MQPLALTNITSPCKTVKTIFTERLAKWPFCTDNLERGIFRNRKLIAMERDFIQPNQQQVINWLIFDLDMDDAYFQAEKRSCPPPNFTAINRNNGHAHVGYLLEMPVTKFEKSHSDPMRFLEAVDFGLSRRLGADAGYSGLMCKNPLSDRWEVDWQAKAPYDLSRLNDWLDKSDKLKIPNFTTALGRNCTIFEGLRKLAYKQVLKFKKDGKSVEQFRAFLLGLALELNKEFSSPLFRQEVNCIAKSVANWVWERFSVAKFSTVQSGRGKKRWDGVTTNEATKPWESLGVSRAKWYADRKKHELSDMAKVQNQRDYILKLSCSSEIPAKS